MNAVLILLGFIIRILEIFETERWIRSCRDGRVAHIGRPPSLASAQMTSSGLLGGSEAVDNSELTGAACSKMFEEVLSPPTRDVEQDLCLFGYSGFELDIDWTAGLCDPFSALDPDPASCHGTALSSCAPLDAAPQSLHEPAGWSAQSLLPDVNDLLSEDALDGITATSREELLRMFETRVTRPSPALSSSSRPDTTAGTAASVDRFRQPPAHSTLTHAAAAASGSVGASRSRLPMASVAPGRSLLKPSVVSAISKQKAAAARQPPPRQFSSQITSHEHTNRHRPARHRSNHRPRRKKVSPSLARNSTADLPPPAPPPLSAADTDRCDSLTVSRLSPDHPPTATLPTVVTPAATDTVFLSPPPQATTSPLSHAATAVQIPADAAHSVSDTILSSDTLPSVTDLNGVAVFSDSLDRVGLVVEETCGSCSHLQTADTLASPSPVDPSTDTEALADCAAAVTAAAADDDDDDETATAGTLTASLQSVVEELISDPDFGQQLELCSALLDTVASCPETEQEAEQQQQQQQQQTDDVDEGEGGGYLGAVGVPSHPGSDLSLISELPAPPAAVSVYTDSGAVSDATAAAAAAAAGVVNGGDVFLGGVDMSAGGATGDMSLAGGSTTATGDISPGSATVAAADISADGDMSPGSAVAATTGGGATATSTAAAAGDISSTTTAAAGGEWRATSRATGEHSLSALLQRLRGQLRQSGDPAARALIEREVARVEARLAAIRRRARRLTRRLGRRDQTAVLRPAPSSSTASAASSSSAAPSLCDSSASLACGDTRANNSNSLLLQNATVAATGTAAKLQPLCSKDVMAEHSYSNVATSTPAAAHHHTVSSSQLSTAAAAATTTTGAHHSLACTVTAPAVAAAAASAAAAAAAAAVVKRKISLTEYKQRHHRTNVLSVTAATPDAPIAPSCSSHSTSCRPPHSSHQQQYDHPQQQQRQRRYSGSSSWSGCSFEPPLQCLPLPLAPAPLLHTLCTDPGAVLESLPEEAGMAQMLEAIMCASPVRSCSPPLISPPLIPPPPPLSLPLSPSPPPPSATDTDTVWHNNNSTEQSCLTDTTDVAYECSEATGAAAAATAVTTTVPGDGGDGAESMAAAAAAAAVCVDSGVSVCGSSVCSSVHSVRSCGGGGGAASGATSRCGSVSSGSPCHYDSLRPHLEPPNRRESGHTVRNSPGRRRRRSRSRSRSLSPCPPGRQRRRPPADRVQQRRDAVQRRVVYVNGLSTSVTHRQLHKMFCRHGEITRIKIIERHSHATVYGASAAGCYAFVTFATQRAAVAAQHCGSEEFPDLEVRFGGRREFCLDQCSDEEEGEHVSGSAGCPGASSSSAAAAAVDFDTLLQLELERVRRAKQARDTRQLPPPAAAAAAHLDCSC